MGLDNPSVDVYGGMRSHTLHHLFRGDENSATNISQRFLDGPLVCHVYAPSIIDDVFTAGYN